MMVNACIKIKNYAVRLSYSVFGKRIGEFVGRKLGYRNLINDAFVHPHAPRCPAVNIESELKHGGMITRCKDCGIAIEIKLAVWETEPGRMPDDVAKWFLEELQKTGSIKELES